MASNFGRQAMRSRPLDLKRHKSGSTFEIKSSLMRREQGRAVNA